MTTVTTEEDTVDVMSNFPGANPATKPDHPAYIMGSTGRAISYKELDDAANQISQLIRACGVERGEHVAFCLENHPDFFKIAWGCAYAGVYWTAMSSRLTVEEMEYILDDCAAKVFITSAYGLGETVVQGAVNPDEFHVHKPILEAGYFPIIRRQMGSKLIKMEFVEEGADKSSTTGGFDSVMPGGGRCARSFQPVSYGAK